MSTILSRVILSYFESKVKALKATTRAKAWVTCVLLHRFPMEMDPADVATSLSLPYSASLGSASIIAYYVEPSLLARTCCIRPESVSTSPAASHRLFGFCGDVVPSPDHTQVAQAMSQSGMMFIENVG